MTYSTSDSECCCPSKALKKKTNGRSVLFEWLLKIPVDIRAVNRGKNSTLIFFGVLFVFNPDFNIEAPLSVLTGESVL